MRVGTIRNISRSRALLLPALAVVLLSVAGCGGGAGGQSASALPPPVPNTGTVTFPAGSEIVGIDVGDMEQVIHVMPDERTGHPIRITRTDASAGYEISVAEGADIASVAERNGRWSLTVDSTSLAAGSSRAYRLRIRNRATGAVAEVRGPIKVLAPAMVGSASITALGATVAASNSTFRFELAPQPGAAPVVVSLLAAPLPRGAMAIRVKFDRSLLGETRGFRLVSNEIPPAAAVGAQATLVVESPCAQERQTFPGFYEWQCNTGVFTAAGRFRLDEFVRTDAGLRVSCGDVAVVADGKTLCAIEAGASTLTGEEPRPGGSSIERDPVLFVNGYTASPVFDSPLERIVNLVVNTGLGGGSATWGAFPTLVGGLNGGQYIPFEFQWATNAKFERVADELASAIDEVHRATGGRKVTIVAHSFGGVLTRTMLQGLGTGDKAAQLGIKDKVSQVITLATPHSGIADTSVTLDGVTLPVGHHNGLIDHCGQIGCHEMGLPALDGDALALANLSDPRPGYLAADLAGRISASAVQFPPSVPLLVGVGLALARTSLTEVEVQPGDGLITFAGQRFDRQNTAALLDCSLPGPQILERVLGNPAWRPRQVVGSDRRGHVHTAFLKTRYGLLSGLNDVEAEADRAAHESFLFVREALTSGSCGSAPTITNQPRSVSLAIGQPAVFEVTATGSPMPTYQWNRNNTAIPGATSASYRIDAVSESDQGAQFTVTVTNTLGSTTSDPPATLTVIANPPTPTDPLASKGRIAFCQKCSLVARINGSMVVAGNPFETGALGVPRFVPGPWIEASSLSSVRQVASRIDHSLAATEDGSLWVTGNGTFGMLGTGGASVAQWTRIAAAAGGAAVPTGVTAVATGGASSYVVTSNNELWVAGSNSYGQLGLAPPPGQVFHMNWARVDYLSGVKAVSSYEVHALVLMTDGTVLGAGLNNNGNDGRLGFGSTAQVTRWQQVPEVSDIVDIAVGPFHSLALKRDGTIWATGDLLSSQTSSFGWTPRRTFGQVPGIEGVKAIAAGAFCSMAIRSDGTLWVAGVGGSSALGLGASEPTYVATWKQVPNMSNVMAVATDCGKSIAIREDGSVWVAGFDTYGQLGMGNSSGASMNYATWTQVPGLSGF